MQGNGLSKACGVVLDGDVLQRYAVAVNLQGVCPEGSHGFPCLGHEDIGVVVVCDDRLVAVLATYLYIVEPRGNVNLLLVDALLDKYHLVVFHEGTAHLDSFGNIAELCRAVAGHEDCVGIIVLAGSLCC